LSAYNIAEVISMQNAEVIRLRDEYSALLRVAEGLIDMIHGREACNVLSFARMAEQARQAARSIASMIERLLVEEKPTPQKRRRLRDILSDVCVKLSQAFVSCW